METLDFSKLTAEELLDRLPDEETTRWEFKDGDFLSKGKRGEFKTELGKQVSAFANSGGGFLVVGVSKDRKLAPTDQLTEGRQTMTDWLAQRTEQCVDPWIRDFHIHKLPMADDPSKAVYVVEVGDSVSAPHQAKDDLTYYYRIPGHSKPAPHFHLELLRNRMTKAVLQLSQPVLKWTLDEYRWPTLTVSLQVENMSSQIAERWGLLLQCDEGSEGPFRCNSRRISGNAFFYGEEVSVAYKKVTIMPTEKVDFSLQYRANRKVKEKAASLDEINSAWQRFSASVSPVSQNSTGPGVSIGWNESDDQWKLQSAAIRELWIKM